jgi:hypothetical protein
MRFEIIMVVDHMEVQGAGAANRLSESPGGARVRRLSLKTATEESHNA